MHWRGKARCPPVSSRMGLGPAWQRPNGRRPGLHQAALQVRGRGRSKDKPGPAAGVWRRHRLLDRGGPIRPHRHAVHGQRLNEVLPEA
jgi:hypothetical protein